jgi:hypothetical protein
MNYPDAPETRAHDAGVPLDSLGARDGGAHAPEVRWPPPNQTRVLTRSAGCGEEQKHALRNQRQPTVLCVRQNAPWKAPVAPWSTSDCRVTATVAVPNEAPTCWAMRVFMVACAMSVG